MKRNQKLGRYARGRKGRHEYKKATTRAERTEAKRQLRKDPESMERQHRRRYWGWDD